MGRAARLKKNRLFCKDFSNRRFKKYSNYQPPEDIVNDLRRFLENTHKVQQEIILHDFSLLRTLLAGYVLDSDPNIPVFALDSKLLELLQQTEIPENLYNFPKVVNNAIFLFPMKTIIDPETGGYISFVIVRDVDSVETNNGDNDFKDFLDKVFDRRQLPPIVWATKGQRVITIYGLSNHNSTLHSITSTVSLDNQGNLIRDNDLKNKYNIDLIPAKDPKVVRKTMNIVLQCLLYLSTQTNEKNYTTKSSINSPNTSVKCTHIVEDFRWVYQKEQKVNKSTNHGNSGQEQVTNTHASPITHWRRGHWRNQPCGEKLQDSKIIWIQPTLINANVGE